MIGSGSLHLLKRNQGASVVIHDESVVEEHLESILETTCHKKMPILSNNMTTLLGELEGILNVLALTVVVQDFVGIDKFSVLLEQDNPGKHV